MDRLFYVLTVGHPATETRHSCSHCLSERDIDVLVEMAAGKARDEIATALHMSTANVAYHITRMSKKLRVRGQAAMVAAALVAGVLTSDRWPVLATAVNCVASLFDGVGSA
ncbi:LuxR C-terminal-related transcriptional regulator [Mesorhizobium japonicum]|uniref:LuxR C-terminal-related transcriptional regulator n=1 Tax=Mesorhizobium japonicum TaxID=2066070 RepID=UPI003B59D635